MTELTVEQFEKLYDSFPDAKPIKFTRSLDELDCDIKPVIKKVKHYKIVRYKPNAYLLNIVNGSTLEKLSSDWDVSTNSISSIRHGIMSKRLTNKVVMILGVDINDIIEE